MLEYAVVLKTIVRFAHTVARASESRFVNSDGGWLGAGTTVTDWFDLNASTLAGKEGSLNPSSPFGCFLRSLIISSLTLQYTCW